MTDLLIAISMLCESNKDWGFEKSVCVRELIQCVEKKSKPMADYKLEIEWRERKLVECYLGKK